MFPLSSQLPLFKIEHLGEDDYIQIESDSQLELIYNIAKIPFDKKIINWEHTYVYNCFCIKTGIRKSFKDLNVGDRIISFCDFIKENLETGGSASTNNKQRYSVDLEDWVPITIKAKGKTVKNVLQEAVTGKNGVEVKNYQPYKLSNLIDKHYVYCYNKEQCQIVRSIAGFDGPNPFDPKYPCINVKSNYTVCDTGWAKQKNFIIISFDDFVKDNPIKQTSLQMVDTEYKGNLVTGTIDNFSTETIAINSKLYNSNSSQFKQPENGKIAIVQRTNLEISTGNPVRGIGLESPRSEIIVGNHSSDYKQRSSTSKKGILKDTVSISLRYPF